jgi:hypothetical protein
MDEAAPVVVLVGHCGPDAGALRSAVRSHLPGARVESVDDPADLEGAMSRAHLLLVNRVLDRGFGGASGIDLIAELSRRPGRPALMLVSNLEDAQARAEAAGASPGFGKRDLYAPATKARLMSALRAPQARGAT